MLAGGIIAEIGDISHFRIQAVPVQYAGFTWTAYQSQILYASFRDF
ncbi:MAG TPA: IS110 family transposase [Firmicutes bacterium]|nr:IS110 family transposase [Bacillota bacterium]